MMYLMEYDRKSPKHSNESVDCAMEAADGKVYGILKEGNTYYIKTTTPDKKNLAESYEYINGFNYRNENGYKSFNEASKQLELKVMNINEAAGKHDPVSVYDFKKSQKGLDELTKEARKELDRMQQLLQNSENIGNCDKCDISKVGVPFDEDGEATLDKDPKGEKVNQFEKLKAFDQKESDKLNDYREEIGLMLEEADEIFKPEDFEDMIEDDDEEEKDSTKDDSLVGFGDEDNDEEEDEKDDDVDDAIDELMEEYFGDEDDDTEEVDLNQLNESIDRITDMVVEQLCGKKKKKTLCGTIDKIVKEEVEDFVAYGKHPKFQKPAFSVNYKKDAESKFGREWDDDSAKGNEPYSRKIGDGKPFSETVKLLTDDIMNQLKKKN